MAKRLSENEKEEIVNSFSFGKTINELSAQFNCSKLTITRNLKKKLGEKFFKELINKNNSSNNVEGHHKTNISVESKNKLNKNTDQENSFQEKIVSDNSKEEFSSMSSFVEISPLDFQIENSSQKDFSSVPILEVEFPKVVYMIVNNKIELEIKYLNDYPEWQFLSQSELSRKTIEIFIDLQNAKRFCNKEQKVIKVPNTEVFKIVAPILLSRGISRIVNSDKLIAL